MCSEEAKATHERCPRSGDSGRMSLAEMGTGKDVAAVERNGYNN